VRRTGPLHQETGDCKKNVQLPQPSSGRPASWDVSCEPVPQTPLTWHRAVRRDAWPERVL